ncbi:unnamed protein product [Protopolystoma xenopodis]|uniref:GHMP kinase C-terminal domain-containing protein n=1 Tax=Protopolystoma xenopodis TaxID=117903 RepID=A0A448WG67_9PLAT|nr:unnamed protein product [Protopolystoma xenopodis]
MDFLQRDDYEVSSPQLDELVELSRCHPGVLGARMTGGGFGGSIIALVRSNEASSYRDMILVRTEVPFPN